LTGKGEVRLGNTTKKYYIIDSYVGQLSHASRRESRLENHNMAEITKEYAPEFKKRLDKYYDELK
jgi:hypothetical protein